MEKFVKKEQFQAAAIALLYTNVFAPVLRYL